MSYYDEIIEKLGFSRFDTNINSTEKTFDDVKDPQIKEELLLIQRVQLYNDFISEQRLLGKYRPLVNNIIAGQTKLKSLVGYDQLMQKSMAEVKNCIRKFDLSATNKPSTYITNSLNLELGKFYKDLTSSNVVNMSNDLNMINNVAAIADSILTPQLGRTPTNQEREKFMKKELNSGLKFNNKILDRINRYKTNEYSGSAIIGSENADGAEALTLEDVVDGDKDVKKIINNSIIEQDLIDAIREYTTLKNERRFLMMVLGIGEFKNSTSKGSFTAAARENGMINYAGKKLFDNFRNYCISKGVL